MAKRTVREKGVSKRSKDRDRSHIRFNLRNAFVSKGENKEALYTRQVEDERDPFHNLYDRNQLIVPPYDFERLFRIYEESDVLQSCVEAMRNNIDGFGYQLQFLGDDRKDKNTPSAVLEKETASNFFDQVNENQSFTTIRKLRREDIEVLGNGAFEVIRNKLNRVQMLYYMPFKKLRLTFMDKTPINIPVKFKRDGKEIEITVKRYFRKYAQVAASGIKLRWFKEFGDPRPMSAVTGEFMDTPRIKASEIMHYKLSFGGMPYGMPRWIGAILDAMGRRSAGFVNYDLFESQGIPPMAILVSGGVLTDESLDELGDIVRSLRGIGKWNKMMLLESNVESVGLEDKGSAKIELKNLSEYRKEDQMFNQYLEATEKHIRHRFRLPPLYVGAAETFCVSADTETLTEHGWKFYDEVSSKERIATINPITKSLEFHIPEGLYIFPFDGDLLHFENRGVDSLVTPEHDMWASWYNSKDSSARTFKKIKAQNMKNSKSSRHIFQQASEKVPEFVFSSSDKIFEVPFSILTRWVGQVIGDGTVDFDGNRIRFTIKKERKKIAFLFSTKKVAHYLRIPVIENLSNSRPGYLHIALKHSELHDWLARTILDSDRTKVLPIFLFSKEMFTGLMESDGHWRNEGSSGTYSTTSKKLADSVQMLAFMLGYRARIVELFDTRTNRKQLYHVQIARTTEHIIMREDIQPVPYKGHVYCFHVENHLFVTRRNGKIAIHGNTHATAKAAQTVAEEQVFIPERMENDEATNLQIVKNELGVEQWKYKSKGPKIVGSTDIPKGVEVFSRSGAFSINHAIDQANAAFGLEMSKYDEPWADYPIPMVTELLKAGRLKGVEEIAEKIQETTSAIGAASRTPTKVTQLKLPGQSTAKKSVFSDEELKMYHSLKSIQATIERNAGYTYDETVNIGL